MSAPRARRLLLTALLGALAAAAGGCAALTVHPWDRDLLAEKRMSFIPAPWEEDIDGHIYFSKEGSTGGAGGGGGGCGCN